MFPEALSQLRQEKINKYLCFGSVGLRVVTEVTHCPSSRVGGGEAGEARWVGLAGRLFGCGPACRQETPLQTLVRETEF